MRVFRDQDAITAKVGEQFGIALKVLGAAGYEWQLQTQAEAVHLTGSDFEVAGASVGGESEQILRFEARKKGQTVLVLACKRPWDSQPSNTVSVKLTVS